MRTIASGCCSGGPVSCGLERGSHPPSLLPRSQDPRVSSGPPGLRQCSVAGEVRFPFSSTRSYPCDGGSPSHVVAPVVLCASQGQFLLRSVHPDSTLQYATRHDNRCWECLCRILRVSSEVDITSQQIASLPLSVGGLGLHSAVFVRHAAYWSSWADCVHMVNKRHPQICRSILRSIATDNPPHHIEGVSISEAAFRLSFFHPPSWEELAEGLRLGRRPIEDEDRTQPRFGWQKFAAESLQLDFRENVLMPSLPVESVVEVPVGPTLVDPFRGVPNHQGNDF